MIKTSVSSYSFGWDKNTTEEGVLKIIDDAASLGFDGIEFVDPACENMERAKLIREKCAEKNIAPIAFCIGANFAISDESALRDEVKRVQGLVDLAAEMGMGMLRHDIAYGHMKMPQTKSYEAAIPFMAKGILEVTKYAEQKGVRTMTENHGFFSQDAHRVEALINAVDHPNFGALVDIGNFMCADEDPAVSVGIMAPYAFHVHCKDFFKKPGTQIDPGEGWFRTRGGNYLRGTVIGFGDANAAQSIGILKRAGYEGYMTVEFEGGEDTMWGIRVGRENMLRFIGD